MDVKHPSPRARGTLGTRQFAGGHSVNIEAAEAFNRVVLDFLRPVEAVHEQDETPIK